VDAPGLLLAALLCAEVAAAGLAVRARVGRPVLALLTFALADELAQLCLHAALDGAPRPLADWYRAGWHVSIALSLGWPAALAWACWRVNEPQKTNGLDLSKPRACLLRQTPQCAFQTSKDVSRRVFVNGLLGAYLGLLAGLAIVYPPSRAGLRWTLLAWELACVAVAWWGLWRARLRTWGAAEIVLVVLVACESAVVLVGPFASDPFVRWWIARAFYLGAWGAVCGVLARGALPLDAQSGHP